MRKGILLFPLALAACGGSSSSSGPAMISPQAAGANPSTVSVTAGSQVQFTNADTIDHQVASSNCSELDSPTLAAGASFTATMGPGPKTCAFADGLQPGPTAFQGTVFVDQPSPPYKSVKAATEIRLAARRLAASWSALDRDQRIPAALLGGVALLLFELRFDHE